jgi:hypothetical protein
MEENENEYLYEICDLWKVFFGHYDDDHVIQTVESFFQSVESIEAFYYFMMSKQLLVDHMLYFTRKYISLLNPVRLIPHIIDGWEDFFLTSNYTLENASHEELEHYRRVVYQVLSFLLTYLSTNSEGLSREEMSYYLHKYNARLRGYFLLYIEDFIDIEL